MKKGIRRTLNYFVLFVVSIIFWEILLRVVISKGISGRNLFFLCFVPAQAMFLTTFSGFFTNKGNKIWTPILLTGVGFYYFSQLIYYKTFGSLYSVSMTGMGGEAVGNFWWAIKGTLLQNIIGIILLLLPIIGLIAFLIISKKRFPGFKLAFRGATLVLTVILWFLGIFALRIGGTDRQSAYYVFHNSLADTDTTSKQLGALTTTLVEGGSYFFGIKGDSTSVALAESVSRDDIMLPAVTTVSEDEVIVEEVVEEIPRDPWINEDIDFNALASATDDQDLKELYTYFAGREPSTTNEMTGMFEGYNLIYICAESFWSYACDETVTPTLYKMSHEGIVLNNYYNSFKNTTTNGEYAFLTSLWPDVSRDATCGTDIGSFAQSASKYMPVGPGDLFTENGIPAYAFHNYYGKYYRRCLSWPNLGYECTFMNEGMTFTTSWPSSDYEMMQQSVDKYINDDQFHVYYMTFSGHGPYAARNVIGSRNLQAVKDLVGDSAEYSDQALYYLAGEYELDKAMDYLLNALEEAGKLDNTVIVLTGDHYPYYLDEDGRASLTGLDIDEDFGIYESTCIIYNAGMEEPIESDVYCCNVDILPTMLNLFNIPYDSRLYMGTDIFSDGIHKAQFYNQSFVTELCKYNSETGEVIWSPLSSSYTEEQLDNYLQGMITLCEGDYAASVKMTQTNFYYNVWVDSGFLSDEEASAEREREQQVAARDEAFNAEDAELEAQKERDKAISEVLSLAGYTPVGVPTLNEDGSVSVDGYHIAANGVVLSGPPVAVTDPATGQTIIVDSVTGQPVADPNATVVDPNASATEPNATETDPNAVAN